MPQALLVGKIYTSTRRKVFSFKSHHSQRISLGIVKADSRGILHSFGRMANSLSRA